MDTGTVKWVYQATQSDNWLGGCGAAQRRQSRLSRDTRARPRFLGGADAGDGERTPDARRAAEVGHRLRDRSRTKARWCGSTASARASGLGGAFGGAVDGQNVVLRRRRLPDAGRLEASARSGWPLASRCGALPRRNRDSARRSRGATRRKAAPRRSFQARCWPGRMTAAFAPTPPKTARSCGSSTPTRTSRRSTASRHPAPASTARR